MLYETDLEDTQAMVDESPVVAHPRLGWGRRVARQAEQPDFETAGLLQHPRLGYGRPVRRGADQRESEVEPEILPPDERRLVTDTRAVPFRWVCCLDLFFPDPDDPSGELFFRGSGTLISPRHVLTAGHCLFDEVEGSRGTRALLAVRRIVVTPGRNGAAASAAARAPFGSTSSSAAQASARWRSAQDPQFDFGVITLRDAIGDARQAALGNQPLGYWGSPQHGAGTRLSLSNPQVLQSNPTVNISGYPGDKCRNQPANGSATPAQIAACPTADWASAQWRALGNITNAAPPAAPRLIFYNLDTFGGHSGSPVWLRWQNFRSLVAVHTGVGISGVANRGVRVTEEVLREVRTLMGGSSAARPTLRRGSRGAPVQELQTRLNVWIAATPGSGLAPLVVDGIFGVRTDAAVRAFQRNQGLTVDGIVGPQTWARLLAL